MPLVTAFHGKIHDVGGQLRFYVGRVTEAPDDFVGCRPGCVRNSLPFSREVDGCQTDPSLFHRVVLQLHSEARVVEEWLIEERLDRRRNAVRPPRESELLDVSEIVPTLTRLRSQPLSLLCARLLWSLLGQIKGTLSLPRSPVP